MKVVDTCCKIFITFTKYLIIVPLVLCAIQFVIIGWLGIDQITRCIAGKSREEGIKKQKIASPTFYIAIYT